MWASLLVESVRRAWDCIVSNMGGVYKDLRIGSNYLYILQASR